MAKLRILIVEGESLIALEIQKIAVDSGYAIAAVCSEAMKAEDLLKSDARIDAALVDVVVRDQNAYGLCKALDKREIPFGFVTGLPRHEITVFQQSEGGSGVPSTKAQRGVFSTCSATAWHGICFASVEVSK